MTTGKKAPAASKEAKTFTVAQLAREQKLDPKVARRRMRANVAKSKPLPTPKAVSGARKNARYTYEDTADARKLVLAIIATPE